MQVFLYDIFLLLYQLGIRIASLFNKKAAKWIAGRRDLLQRVKATLPHNERRIWMHCASVGEFEQGRPLIEAIKRQYPAYKIVLTFFSPSGYELRKDYELADYVFYLPMDGRVRSEKFVRAVNPTLAIFVKYDFWYYHICNLHRRGVPVVLVSGAFRKDQIFFKWYGGLFRKLLGYFHALFVQDEMARQLLHGVGLGKKVEVAGDTRYDRVSSIAALAERFPLVEEWRQEDKLLIAGSTWEPDEQVLVSSLSALPDGWKVIVAPHEVTQAHIRSLQRSFPDSVLYSQLGAQGSSAKVLIIDNIGMLASLFRYGAIAFIGGGFDKGGIHNTLEPAVFGLPVLFGPYYKKFVEAVQLVELQLAYPVKDADSCRFFLTQLTEDDQLLHAKQQALKAFVARSIGATDFILSRLPLKENRQTTES